MPRRKPASSKQRKAELQLKRAIKRGDVSAPTPQPKPPRSKKIQRDTPNGMPRIKIGDPSSKRLQSAFLKVEPEFLEESKFIAATDPLPRPLSPKVAILDGDEIGLYTDKDVEGLLTCPKRPKWRFDMEKKEVERNEEAMYQRWMSEVDEYVYAWRAVKSESQNLPDDAPGKNIAEGKSHIQKSPTYYERNLEVWRQFWRVSEISQIMLLLLDSRCPALHFPPSLHMYLSTLRPSRPLILVLTKSDLVPASYTAAWSAWLRNRYPSIRVVKVESYRPQDVHEERKGQGQRRRFDPEMNTMDLHELVAALKAAHKELITAPEKLKDNEEKLKKWKPNVRETVDWGAALLGGRVHIEESVDDDSQEFITIGLVGQPNVGKSSLLNALFGAHKVKASRTPGKTKHFQTLFWTPNIRLVDCPGLVMPNFVRMELQVLCGILPISQIPSIPSCLHYASRLLPLEQILHLSHPSDQADVPQDKRTWRGDRPVSRQTDNVGGINWTTMDLLTAYANSKGWVTAKAGRPDAHRAGNALLRALAEGKIRWAFWPPDMPLPEARIKDGLGIWLGDQVEEVADGDRNDVESSESESDSLETASLASSEEQNDEFEEGSVRQMNAVGVGRFGALTLEEEAETSLD
ncbi:P-loop containing nucleoside triphosphate hydrolase protein [Ramaria rubella]|nr:P-loop containing nucleoside triphosphate hydrolase protein [Ramaria rubella]